MRRPRDVRGADVAQSAERLATVDAGAPVIEAAGLLSKPHPDIVVAVVCERGGGTVGVVTKTDIV